MEAFKATSNGVGGGGGGGGNCAAAFSPSLQVLQDWDFCVRLESCDLLFKPILDKFGRDTKATLGHLLTVHNKTCGCQIECASELNRVWNQRKVPFMELHKLSGLAFDDFLSRVLRLLLNNSIQEVEPLSESDFWLFLRQPQFHHHHHHQHPHPAEVLLHQQAEAAPIKGDTIDDEELADIQNFILNDIVEVSSQQQQQQQQQQQHDSSSAIQASATAAAAVSSASSSSSSSSFECADELARMKRKEKHMAPVDCTGVSANFGLTWFCRHCGRTHKAKEDCDQYRGLHDWKHVLLDFAAGTGGNGMPAELIMRSDGVYTSKFSTVKALTRLGPLRGVILDESKMDFDEDRSHVWLLYCEDGSRKCISTADAARSNWMRSVTPADSPTEANVLAVSSKDQIYLVTTEDLPPGTKLCYFAKEDPTTEFWTTWTNAWANQRKCSRCSVHGQFDSVVDYRVHIALWHDLSFQGNPQNRIYYCPDCNAKHIGAKDIVQHCRDAHGTLPFQCRHCTKRFETYNSLIKHKNRIHSEEKPLRKTCDKCSKVYLDPKALKQHVKQVHERSEQLHCDRCERILSSKYALNRHVKEVHQRQQEHTCHKCKKHFTQQSNLKQHMLIHLGVKPFICQHGSSCKSAFTTKQTLQVHYRKVHHYDEANMPRIKKQSLLTDDQEKHEDDDSAQSSNNSFDTSSEFESSESTSAPMVEVPPMTAAAAAATMSSGGSSSVAAAAAASVFQLVSRVNQQHGINGHNGLAHMYGGGLYGLNNQYHFQGK